MNLCSKIVARASRLRCRAHGRDARATTCRFMGSLHAFFVAHWDQEPEIRKLFGIKPSVFRFMESLHVIFGAHWDHEPRRVRSAGFRACGFGRLSSRPFLVHRTRKSGKPAGWKACATSRFMESLHPFFRAHCDHEPYLRKSLVCKSTIFRFMGSLHDFDAAHWDHEPLTAWSPGFSRPKLLNSQWLAACGAFLPPGWKPSSTAGRMPAATWVAA